jgi:hypothetical protein
MYLGPWRNSKATCPKRLDDKKRKLALQLYREGKHPINEICQMMGISNQTGTATCGMEHNSGPTPFRKRPLDRYFDSLHY